jgi:cytidylate kinase
MVTGVPAELPAPQAAPAPTSESAPRRTGNPDWATAFHEAKKMKTTPPIAITISRQLGSGGSYVGQQLAKELDIFYADREIIHEAAKRFSLQGDDLDARDEKIRSIWQSCLESYAFVSPEMYSPPAFFPSDRELCAAEADIIRSIASERSAIIIGRCGAHILRQHPHHLSLFLYSDAGVRQARIKEIYALSDDEAKQRIAQNDKERTHYFNKVTGHHRTDARQYDLCIDTGRIGLDATVTLILDYLAMLP